MYVIRNQPMRVEEKVLLTSISLSILVGVIEVVMGLFSKSISLTADGVQSFADSIITILVLTGIRLSKRAPDGKFHHGYGRAEQLFGMQAAVVMVIIGVIVFYQSYLAFQAPTAIDYPNYAIGIALAAFFVGTAMALYKIRLARKAGSQGLAVDAYNSIKDGAGSLVVVVGIAFSSYGYLHFDAIAGIIISFMIIAVGYVSIKESSIILMDGCLCSDRFEAIITLAGEIKGIKKIHNLKFRKTGRDLIFEAVVQLEGDIPISEAYVIVNTLKQSIMKEDPEVGRVTNELEPAKNP